MWHFQSYFSSQVKSSSGLFKNPGRANLGGPDLQLLKDKINIITFITIKDSTK